jgi:hypothetical protein
LVPTTVNEEKPLISTPTVTLPTSAPVRVQEPVGLVPTTVSEERPVISTPTVTLPTVRVGDKDNSPIRLAAGNFPSNAYDAALKVLKELQTAGTAFESTSAIIEEVNRNAEVAGRIAEHQAERQQRAMAEQRRATVICRLSSGTIVRVGHIEDGTWRSLNRTGSRQHDYELVTAFDGNRYSFHVHPPRFRGGTPIPGEVMVNGYATMTQTPVELVDAIINLKGRPPSGAW